MRLLSHWNLRDEIKADYADAKDGLAKQRDDRNRSWSASSRRRFPQVVIDNPHVDWNPFTNDGQAARRSRTATRPAPAGRSRRARPSPTRATRCCSRPSRPRARPIRTRRRRRRCIARRFDEDRQIPEARVKAMLEEVLTSPLVPKVAALIEKRLGRPLEPFDIWYDGFRPRGAYTEARARRDRPQDDTRRRRPTRRTSRTCSCSSASRRRRPQFLADHIVVDPARGSGHAMGAAAAGDQAHLRTRVEQGRHELQGLQHRRPRDGPQRRADLLAQRRRLHAPRTACPTPPSPRRSRSSSRRTTSSCSACRSRTPKTQALEDAERLLGDLRDRRRGARRHGRLALDVRPPRRDARGS